MKRAVFARLCGQDPPHFAVPGDEIRTVRRIDERRLARKDLLFGRALHDVIVDRPLYPTLAGLVIRRGAALDRLDRCTQALFEAGARVTDEPDDATRIVATRRPRFRRCIKRVDTRVVFAEPEIDAAGRAMRRPES